MKDCEKPVKSSGYCGAHYQRMRRHGSAAINLKGEPVQGVCSVKECESAAYCKSLCHGHYKRMLAGRPLAGAVRERNSPSDGKKRCPGCKTTKALSEFPKAKNRVGSWCKGCQRYSQKRMKYGLSRDEYDLLSANGCVICASQLKLVVDHHHGTGSVRGVLCTQCNVALGMSKDSPERLERMASYLRGELTE